MTELLFPWLEASVLIPLLGSLVVARCRDPERARTWCLIVAGLTLAGTVFEWQDFNRLHVLEAHDRWDLTSWLFGHEMFLIDELSAPLLPLIALFYFLTILTTLRTKIRRFSFGGTLVSESLALATFSCREPCLLIGLLAVSSVPPLLEIISRRRPARVFAIYMGLSAALMCLGYGLLPEGGAPGGHSGLAVSLLLIGILIRSGLAPFHGWVTHLYENATFGTALLHTAPIAGAYAAVRLLLPIASDPILRGVGLLALFTAWYTAGLALVQRDGRRLFCYLLLSHSALVFTGLEMVTPLGLTGALCLWLSVILSLGGFGLTIRALEARIGAVHLRDFQGLFEHTPVLAACFFLSGLASIGFPGTAGFIGTEMLVDGAVQSYPYVGVAVVIASALNGIAVVRAYFVLFTGSRHSSTVSLRINERERIAVLVLAGLIFAGGLFPQPGVHSRHHAAEDILKAAGKLHLDAGKPHMIPAAHH